METIIIQDALVDKEQFFDLTGHIIAKNFDYVLEGRELSELEAPEKTYLGTRFQRKFQTEMSLPYAKPLDTKIDGIAVDIKFTIGRNWMIPPECIGEQCMLISADYNKKVFSFGLFKAETDLLTNGANRDKKKTVSAKGKKTILWLCRNRPYLSGAI